MILNGILWTHLLVTFMRLYFIPHYENLLTILVGILKLLGDLSYEGEEKVSGEGSQSSKQDTTIAGTVKH